MIQQMILVFKMVPGGGIEPPWNCFRRILSPLRPSLPFAASDCGELPNHSVVNRLTQPRSLLFVADDCQEYGYKHAPKRAPDRGGNQAPEITSCRGGIAHQGGIAPARPRSLHLN
jgi:hypothetical protein